MTTPTPAKKHFPVSAKEIETWLERVNEISTSVKDFLDEDPEEAERRRQERDKKLLEAKVEAHKKKIDERYNTENYRRYDDAAIEAMLKEVDEPKRPETKLAVELTDFERITLEEARRLKEEGNKEVKGSHYETALTKYNQAIGMEPPGDEELIISLHNNRSLVLFKLGKYADCVNDATYVLQREKFNVKALMRRASALTQLQRPREALEDVARVFKADAKNVEASTLEKRLRRECVELGEFEALIAEDVETAQKLNKELISAKEIGEKVLGAGATDEKALEGLCVALCEIGSILNMNRLFAIQLRISDSLPFFHELLYNAASTQLVTPVQSVTLMAVLRILGTVYSHPAALDVFTNNVSKKDQEVAEYLIQSCEKVEASPILCSVLQFLTAVALAETFGIFLTEIIPEKKLEKWLQKPMYSSDAMKLAASLLQSEVGKKRYSSVSFFEPIISGIKDARGLRNEAAIGLLLRLSSSPQWLQTFVEKHKGIQVIIDEIPRVATLQKQSTMFVEGILAVLQNTMQYQEHRETSAKLLAEGSGLGHLTIFLSDISKDQKKCRIYSNVAARAVGTLSKAATVNPTVVEKVSSQPRVFIDLVNHYRLISDDYAENVIEGSSLLLATLSRDAPTSLASVIAEQSMVQMMMDLLKHTNDRIVGNAALIIGCAPLKEFIGCGGVMALLNAITTIRSKVHQLESLGEKNSTQWRQGKSAIKNAAISLASFCRKDSAVMDKVREERGVEILHASMETE